MEDLTTLGEGVSLAGQYGLEQRIGGDHSAAFFSASRSDGQRALVKLIPVDALDAEPQLATWQRTRHLRHPRLLELYDLGRTQGMDAAYLYAAFEYPDDNLASAIEQGPITEEETRQVLDAAVDALRYLHGQGLVHGALVPQNIVAVGNTIKLATDSLRESDGLQGHAEDVRQLGELVQSLLAPGEMSEPLATVVHHATEPDLRRRWTLAEIAAEMRPREVIAAPVPVTVEPAEPAVLHAAAPCLQLEHEPEPAHAAGPAPILPAPARRPSLDPSTPIGFPKWIFAALAAVLVLILAFNLRRKTETPARPVPATAEPAAPPQPLPPLPVPSAAAKQQLASTTPSKPAHASGAGMWRVIAFTYKSHDAAAKKAKHVNERWPDLHATVFSPKERRGYYLVALGGRMTREDALRVQRKARGAGLPRDTYLQNYSN